jgi:5-methylcytosine-specific restriction endonuclease McrA
MWFQVDDQAWLNAKHERLRTMAADGDLRGLAAKGLWTDAGSRCQSVLTDGVVTTEALISLYPTLSRSTVLELASLLVEVGLWHGPGHSCERCPEVEPGTWIYHDWFAMGYETAEQVRRTRGKRRELRDKKITDAVWARDRIGGVLPGGDAVARCRYCGTPVHRKKRSEWQFDHVDPRVFIGAANIVVSCKACNLDKQQRPLEESGMTLHRPGWAPGEPDWRGPLVVDGRTDAGAPAVESRLGDGKGTAEPVPHPAEDSRRAALPTLPRHEAAAQTGDGGGAARVVESGPGDGKGTAVPVPHSAEDSRRAASPPVDVQAAARQSPGRITARSRQDPGKYPAAEEVSTRARARQGRARQGRERDEVGTWQGLGGHGDQQPRSKRRRRHGSRKPQLPEPPPSQPSHESQEPGRVTRQGLAGAAPDPGVPGRFGSPWYGWRGRPPDDEGEATCLEHGEPVPCRRCLEEQWRAEAEQ